MKTALSCTLLLVFVGALCSGCAKEPAGRPADAVADEASPADQAKIKEYLKTAGVQGEISAISDAGAEWVVSLSDPPPAEDTKTEGDEVAVSGALAPPRNVKVNKTTGKVTDAFTGGAPK